MGVFAPEVLLDILVYGLIGAAVDIGTFAVIVFCFLWLAFEMMDLRRSFFHMGRPGTEKRPYTQWAHDVWGNQFLFWSVVAGFLITFPLIYIPVINDVVFKHTDISWEWAVAFIAFLVFACGVEGWKFAKRVFFRRRHRAHPEEEEGFTGVFAAW